MMRRAWTALIALTAVLALPAAAHADGTICLADPACPPGALLATSLADLETKAQAGTDHDVLRIGPGTFSTPDTLSLTDPSTLSGAGLGATVIDYSGAGTGLSFGGATDSSISRLSMRISHPDADAIRLADGADAFEVGVSSTDPAAAGNSAIIMDDSGSLVQRARVEMASDTPTASAVYAFGDARIEDSYIAGGIGIGGQGPAQVRRTTVRATIPVRVFGGSIEASNLLLTPHPNPDHPYWVGVDVSNQQNEEDVDGSFEGSNLTIDGRGRPSSTGIWVDGGVSMGFTDGDASALVEGAVVRGVTTAMRRSPMSAVVTASLTIRSSSFDGTKIANESPGMWGTFSASPLTNLTNDTDPRFLDPAALDYRLRFDSPLIDKGDMTPLFPDETPDLDGNARVVDSNGDGTARVDIGAQEYQRLPPSAAFSASSALFGEPTLFDAGASADPDGEGIASYVWSFGDGSAASGAQAQRAYALPASYPVALTVTDASGLSASASGTATLSARAGRCANQRAGGSGADRIVGLAFGDRLLGGRGADRLSGGAGQDCLDGESGNDRLSGGSAADRLEGRSGKDRIAGDAGKDRVSGGSGNDSLSGGKDADRLYGGAGNDSILARKGGKDRIDCGPGRRDKVTVDKADRVKRCERVKRRKR